MVVRAWNPAAERLYETPASVAIGRQIDEVLRTTIAGVRSESGDQLHLPAVADYRGRTVDTVLIGPGTGRTVTVDFTASPLVDEHGQGIGIMGVNRDVSAVVALEDALLRLTAREPDRVPTPAELGGVALDALLEATGAQAGIVARADPGRYEVLASDGVPAEILEQLAAAEVANSRVRALLRLGPRVVAHRVDDPAADERIVAAARAIGATSYLMTGLGPVDDPSGFIVLATAAEAPRWPPDSTFVTLASQLTRALEYAELLAELDRRLGRERRLASRLDSLIGIGRLEPDADARSAAQALIDQLVDSLGAVAGVVGFEEDGRYVPIADHEAIERLPAIVGRPVAEFRAWQRFEAGEGAFVQPYVEGAVSPSMLEESSQAGFSSYAAFPIRTDGRLHGVAALFFGPTVEQSPIDARTLEAIGRVVSIAFDNQRLREHLVASEVRYRTLFEASPEPYLLTSAQRTVLAANGAAAALFRLGQAALVGCPLDELLPADAIAEERTGAASDETAARTSRRSQGCRGDGSTFPCETLAQAVTIEGEERVLVLVRDLSDQERLQQELVQAQKMEAIGLLVAGVAHELNNPLAAIVGFSQLLRADPRLPADMKSMADQLIDQTDRTRRIVGGLLDFARQRPPERHPTPIRPLIQSVIDLQSYSYTAGRIAVEVDIAPDVPPVELDRSQIQQVLLNLTLNAVQAIRAARDHGTLRIGAAPTADGSRIRIVVEDDGGGIPESDRARLFVPFFTTKAPGEGTGLGLAVSAGIVVAHGGRLWHEPREGGGSRFAIELPVQAMVEAGPSVEAGTVPVPVPDLPVSAPTLPAGEPVDPIVSPSPSSATLATPADRANGHPPRVLVLDDEQPIRDFIVKALRISGVQAVAVGTGVEAVELAMTDAFDAMLCDHRMAGMSGTAVYEAIADVQPDLAARFVFMSGDVLNPELRTFATDRGIGLLAKPFDLAAVSSTVQQVLERA
jgi:PAS domain S-box-containing protein